MTKSEATHASGEDRELYRRWREANFTAPSVEQIVELLIQTYRARPIAASVFGSGHFANDEELRHGVSRSLWTVTDPVRLLRSAQYRHGTLDAYLEYWEGNERDELEAMSYEDEIEPRDNDWRALEQTSPTEYPYELMLIQMSRGQRLLIVLEVEDGLVTGFKVEGILGDLISDHLTAVIGFPEPQPSFHEAVPCMKRGDLGDEMFVRHLYLAQRFGLL